MKKTLIALIACLAALCLAPAALADDMPEGAAQKLDLPATADEAEALIPLDEQKLEQYVPLLHILAFEQTEDGKHVVTFDKAPRMDDFKDGNAEKWTNVELRDKGTQDRLQDEDETKTIVDFDEYSKYIQNKRIYTFLPGKDVEASNLYVNVHRTVEGLTEFDDPALELMVDDQYDNTGAIESRIVICVTGGIVNDMWNYAVWNGQLKLDNYTHTNDEPSEADGLKSYTVFFSKTDGCMSGYSYETRTADDQSVFLNRMYSPYGELMNASYRAGDGNVYFWYADKGMWALRSAPDAPIETLPEGMPEHPEELEPPFAMASPTVTDNLPKTAEEAEALSAPLPFEMSVLPQIAEYAEESDSVIVKLRWDDASAVYTALGEDGSISGTFEACYTLEDGDYVPCDMPIDLEALNATGTTEVRIEAPEGGELDGYGFGLIYDVKTLDGDMNVRYLYSYVGEDAASGIEIYVTQIMIGENMYEYAPDGMLLAYLSEDGYTYYYLPDGTLERYSAQTEDGTEIDFNAQGEMISLVYPQRNMEDGVASVTPYRWTKENGWMQIKIGENGFTTEPCEPPEGVDLDALRALSAGK